MDPEIIRLADELVEVVKRSCRTSNDAWCKFDQKSIPFLHGSYKRSSVYGLALKSFLDSNTFTRPDHRDVGQQLHWFFQQYHFKDLSEDLRWKWDHLVFCLFLEYGYNNLWKRPSDLLVFYKRSFQELSASISAAEADWFKERIESLRATIRELELHFRDKLIKAIQESKRALNDDAFLNCFNSNPFNLSPFERFRAKALTLESLLNSNAFASVECGKVARFLVFFFHAFIDKSFPKALRKVWKKTSYDLFQNYIRGVSCNHHSTLLQLCEEIFQKVSISNSATEVDHLRELIGSLRTEFPELELRFRNKLIEVIQESKRGSNVIAFNERLTSIPFPWGSIECCRVFGFTLIFAIDSKSLARADQGKVSRDLLEFFHQFPYESLTKGSWDEWCELVQGLFQCFTRNDPFRLQGELLRLWNKSYQERVLTLRSRKADLQKRINSNGAETQQRAREHRTEMTQLKKAHRTEIEERECEYKDEITELKEVENHMTLLLEVTESLIPKEFDGEWETDMNQDHIAKERPGQRVQVKKEEDPDMPYVQS